MEIAMVGLGKMGGNMTKRLIQGGHRLVVTARTPESIAAAVKNGAIGMSTFEELVSNLSKPRAVWVMVPAGDPTESVINQLSEHMAKGDIIIDGGNSNYKDTIRRAELLARIGIQFVDVGTSGGIWGLAEGYSMMVGGNDEAVEHILPVLETLAPAADKGWGHVGPAGSGHFVKMVHNGIEYGLMQSYAEGFDILRAKEQMALDLHQIAKIWQYGSVVRSWLLDLTANALADDPELSDIKGWVADSGEGRWTVFEGVDLDIPAPFITLALQMRFISRQDESYAAKLLAAMRNQFGGHAVKSAK